MAKLNMTAKSVAGLKPPAKRVDYFDIGQGAVPGFFLRMTPNGVKTYGVLYRHAGRLRRFTLGTTEQWTLANARLKARAAIQDSAQGVDQAAEKKLERIAETFGDLAEAYIERYAKKRKRSWPEDERIIDVHLKQFKNVRASEVKRADVRVMLESIAEDAPVMANRVLSCIRKIFNWGIASDIVEANPCNMLAAPGGKEKSRDRVLTDEELKKVWAACEKEKSQVSEVYQLRLVTAQRGGEVLSMRWADVDMDGGWWTIPAERSKNKLPHRVWLSDPALRILKKAAERNAKRTKRAGGKSQWVFPGQRKNQHVKVPKMVKADIAKAAGIAQWTGHDLRRTAASNMASIGVPRFVIGRVLNHVEPGVTAVYDRHSYDAEKKDALDRWAQRLTTIVSGLQVVASGGPELSRT